MDFHDDWTHVTVAGTERRLATYDLHEHAIFLLMREYAAQYGSNAADYVAHRLMGHFSHKESSARDKED